MSDPSQPETPKRGSSILYAIGKLAAQTERNMDDLRALPQRVVEVIQPQLAIINTALLQHDGRLAKLERGQWLWAGGVAVFVPLVGYVVHLMEAPH